MTSRRVTLPEPRHGGLCTMDTQTLTIAAVPRIRRRDAVLANFAAHAHGLVRAARTATPRPGFVVDEARHVDSDAIDPNAWLDWGRVHLTQDEFDRRARAVQVDRAAQRVCAR